MTETSPQPVPEPMAAPQPPAGRYAALLRRNLLGRHSRLLITGMRGSGASAVASLLQQIGFFLGPELDPLTLESRPLQPLLKAGKSAAARAMLEGWCEGHERVACKSVDLFSAPCAPLVQALPSDWLVLAVCRDPAALAQRSVHSGGAGLAQQLVSFARQQDELVHFALTSNKSVLFVSYERLMLSPEVAFAEILTHVEPGPEPLPAFASIWDTLLQQRESYRRQANRPHDISGVPAP